MLVKKPPMGWNSWNTFTGDIDERLILETAEAMADEGLLDAGYEYLVIDDIWQCKKRDKNGKLRENPEKFPHGMKYIADRVHEKGLKFGMYSCDGMLTCGGYPGSFGHEFEDAQYFADIGVDYLKYDNCCKPRSAPGEILYQKMAMALKATGRDIVFSACNWGAEKVHTWARSVGADLYRSTEDINDTFESICKIAESQLDKYCYSAPGCFNDMDMLVAGNSGNGNVGRGYGCTESEYRFHFAFWCMMGSPLMIGCDVRNLSPENRKLILNPYLIRIDQDEEARPPIHINKASSLSLKPIELFKHLSGGEYALGIFNTGDQDLDAFVSLVDIGLTAECGYGLALTDVFNDSDSERFKDYIRVSVPSHDCRVFMASLVK